MLKKNIIKIFTIIIDVIIINIILWGFIYFHLPMGFWKRKNPTLNLLKILKKNMLTKIYFKNEN